MDKPQVRVVYFDLGNTLVTGHRRWVPGAREALATLRAANISLGIISNTDNLSREELLELLPPDFDPAIFGNRFILSSEAGVEKPKAEIFRLAVDRSGVSPLETVYCGEDLSEVLAAQMAGMLGARVSVDLDADDVVKTSDVARLADEIVGLQRPS